MKPQPKLPNAFAELGLELTLLKGLDKAGFEQPTDVQREMIPVLLKGVDVLGQARTGTGKTAAFGLPILQRLDETKGFQALIVVPTRELAVQVTAEIRRLGEFTPFHAVPIYGGQAIKHQVKVLGRRTHLIVATPGRMIDMVNRRILQLSEVRYVVLDEVDRMLDIGFIDDIRKILSQITQPHQTILVSATVSREVTQLARQFMHEPHEVDVSHDDLTVDNINQVYCSVEGWDKYRMLSLVLQRETPKLAIVFTNTKHAARKLAKKLHQQGINVKEIHGDLVQRKRERVMDRFRRHKIDVLVATDLAARGIDVNDISHIINYDLPKDPQVYVHRIGRTARMGAFGRAISFVTSDEGGLLTAVEMLINKQIELVQFHGFKARPPREQAEPALESVSRSRTSVFGTGSVVADEAPAAVPPKTLGSKFKPRRRR